MDADADGIFDENDNCSVVYNPGSRQCDTDCDGYGNMCDGDFDQDYFVFPNDRALWLLDFGPPGFGVDSGIGSDMDCNGTVSNGGVNGNDYEDRWYPQFTSTGNPGPSGCFSPLSSCACP